MVGYLPGIPKVADASAQGEILPFTTRSMKSVVLPLRNSSFESLGFTDQSGIIMGWEEISPRGEESQVKLSDGRSGGRAVSIVSSRSSSEDGTVHQLYQDISLNLDETIPVTVSVSAWVWSDTPGGAFIKLSNLKGREAVSAFHSGGSRWENLTVVYPYDEKPSLLRVSLVARIGTALFGEIRPIATYDDRFTKILPDGCNPLRERATYQKDDRIRIVVVGNSTVNGHAVADKRATFPYVLQLKLEAFFPGRFEVINFGQCAWHLPPQIITLDKAFNSNKACDGATWCAGKDGQFSHKKILIAEQNADNNTPTISQLKPDIIIFAGMWNDIWRVLKYAGWGISPNPDEVNRNGEIPLSVEYMKAVFKYADHPNEKNYLIADKLFERAMMPINPQTLANLQFCDYLSLKKSIEFARLEDNARIKFRYLVEEFIRRGQRYSNVWTITLPSRFGDSYEEAGKKLMNAGLVPAEKIDNFLINGYVDAVTERIQNQELISVSKELGAKSHNLSKFFRQQYGAMPMSEQFSMGYFLENVEDNAHFRYRGNEWIADQIFQGFFDEFMRLKR